MSAFPSGVGAGSGLSHRTPARLVSLPSGRGQAAVLYRGAQMQLPGKLGRRHGGLTVLREASATEIIEVQATEAKPAAAGNGSGNGNGVYVSTSGSNGNGAYASSSNGNGNGVYASSSNGNGNGNGASSNGNGSGAPLPYKAPANGAAAAVANGAAVIAANGAAVIAANGAAAAAANGAVVATAAANGAAAAAANGAAAAAAAATATATPAAMTSLDMAIDPQVAGHLETAAAVAEAPASKRSKTAAAASSSSSSSSAGAADTAAGTPYKNPGGRWSQFKTYSTAQRTLEIYCFAIQFAWKYVLLNQKWTYGKEGMTPAAVSARKTELAKWLREGLVKLGPTFIKIGQQFSTRVDVLAPEFIKELEKLQDRVPPFDSATAVKILEDSLGRPVSQVFDEFDVDPIAAASLGQVHLAKVNGQPVVVKVQRPGLKELFDIDLKNIRALAVWLQKVDPKNDGAARDWVAIYDECSRILYEEIDYTLEGKNADKFRQCFAGVDWVKVPEVLWQYSSPKVLVLEYVPGVKINDAAAIDAMGLDRTKLARLSVECYLQQILRHGFFHADPHPGNVAVDAANGGRLIYYDFGMMGSIPGDVRTGLVELFYSVYNRDVERCLGALVTMGVYVPTGDKTAIRRTGEFFLNTFQERLDSQRQERASLGSAYNASFKPQRSKDEAKARRKQILASIGEDLLLAANDQPFRFPAAFTFVVRSFTVLDGIGKSLDPRFDISEIAAPYARELLLEAKPMFAKFAADLQRRSANQNRAVINLFKGPNAIDDIASTMKALERGDLKLRVRALEAERALNRVQAWQRVIMAGLVASALVNVGTVLSVSALATGATVSFVGAGVFGLLLLKNYLKIMSLEKKEAQLAGAA